MMTSASVKTLRLTPTTIDQLSRNMQGKLYSIEMTGGIVTRD
jgi:hypothetical protein